MRDAENMVFLAEDGGSAHARSCHASSCTISVSSRMFCCSETLLVRIFAEFISCTVLLKYCLCMFEVVVDPCRCIPCTALILKSPRGTSLAPTSPRYFHWRYWRWGAGSRDLPFTGTSQVTLPLQAAPYPPSTCTHHISPVLSSIEG